MPKYKHVVVIDLSECGQVRAGLGGDRQPRAVFPAIVGTAPAIRRGDAFDWKALGTALVGVYKAMGRRSDAAPILLVLPIATDMTVRGHLARLAFNELRAPALQMVDASVAALRASDRTTGVVALLGDEDAQVGAVHQGALVGARRLDLGGRRKSLPRESVALDYDEELQTAPTLRRPIVAAAALAQQTEAYFKPNLLGRDQEGIHRHVYETIRAAAASLRPELSGAVVLAGSAAAFPGIDVRLAREVKALAPDSMTIHVIAPPDPEHAVFIGGSILSSLSTFEEMWVTAPEYDQSGSGIFDRKR